MSSKAFKRCAALGAAVLGVALSAPLAAQQTGRDSPRGAWSAATDTSACNPLSGRQRESCISQIERDDAQRGVTNTARNAGPSAGAGASQAPGVPRNGSSRSSNR